MSEEQQELPGRIPPYGLESVPELETQIANGFYLCRRVGQALDKAYAEAGGEQEINLTALSDAIETKVNALVKRLKLRLEYLQSENDQFDKELGQIRQIATGESNLEQEAKDLAVSLANARDEIDALRVDRDALRAALVAEQATKAPALEAAERDAAAPIQPGDPREIDALRSELEELREARNTAQTTIEELRKQREKLDAEIYQLRQKLSLAAPGAPTSVSATRAAAPVSPTPAPESPEPAPVEGGE